MRTDIYYFGCNKEAGHYLFNVNLWPVYDSHIPDDFPVADRALDGGLLPPRYKQVQGIASVTHVNGWTILSFWDRSVDERLGCNSNFIWRGIHDFDAIIKEAKEAFPTLWKRFKFQVVPR